MYFFLSEQEIVLLIQDSAQGIPLHPGGLADGRGVSLRYLPQDPGYIPQTVKENSTHKGCQHQEQHKPRKYLGEDCPVSKIDIHLFLLRSLF